jgi:hypothetical protein
MNTALTKWGTIQKPEDFCPVFNGPASLDRFNQEKIFLM